MVPWTTPARQTNFSFRSTGPKEINDSDSTEKTSSDRTNVSFDDQQSSGGSDTFVPEVLDDENDDMIVDNKSPREENITFVLTPPPTLLVNTDTSQIRK